MAQKIVINDCYGGFGISDEAWVILKERGLTAEYDDDISRIEPLLIDLIEERGTEFVSSFLANLKIVSIPDHVRWAIEEYDGAEWIAEEHMIWR